MLFAVEKTPVLPFEQMNLVHYEELHLANSIFIFLSTSNVNRDERNKILDQMLKNFIVHVRDHFQYEEELMADTNCPILNCHRDEHQKTLKEMIEVFREYHETRNGQLLVAYLEFQFKPWILDHISSMDMVTAMYFEKYENGEELPTGGCSGHSKNGCI